MGINIHEYVDGSRGFIEFFALLHQLPSSSKFKSAVSNDPELARRQVMSLSDDEIREIMEERDGDEEVRVPLEGYTMEIEKLNQVIDEIKLLRLSMSGDKNTKFERTSRPETETEVLLKKRIEVIEEYDRSDFMKEIGF